MKKKLQLMMLALILCMFFSGCELTKAASMAAQDVRQSHTERYGSGTTTDYLTQHSELVSYYGMINKLYDHGQITANNRDNRKRELNAAYDNYNARKISLSEWRSIRDRLTRL